VDCCFSERPGEETCLPVDCCFSDRMKRHVYQCTVVSVSG
jgi:hypothetical protein